MYKILRIKFCFLVSFILFTGCSVNMPNQSSPPGKTNQRAGRSTDAYADHERHAFRQDPKALWEQFDQLMYQREFEKAIQLGTTLLRRFPNDATGYNSRGAAYAITEQHERALKDFAKAIELNPNEPAFLNNRAASYTYMGKNDIALIDYTQSIALDPSNAASYRGRAEIYRNLKNYDQSLDDLNQAIILDPQNADAYYNRGWIFHNQGKMQKAVVDYNQAISLNVNVWYFYRDRAGAHYIQGEWNKAMADCNKWITLNSEDSNAFTLRSSLYWMMGQYDMVLTDANYALTLNAHNAEAYTNRGIANWVQGFEDQAINDLKQGTQVNPKASNCYFHLGFFMHETGERDRSKRYFEEAQQLNPKILTYRQHFAEKNRSLFSKTREFYEREIDVAVQYLREIPEQEKRSQEQVSLQIHSISTNSSKVNAGSKFELRVEYTAADPFSSKDEISITFGYKISEGSKTLFKSKPVEVKSFNGQKMAHTVYLSAAKQKGKYEIDVNLQYKDKRAEQMVGFEIQ